MKSILARMLALDRGLSLPSRSDGKACLLPACSPFLSTFSAGPCMETPPGFQQRGATQKRRVGNLSPKAVQDFLRFPNFPSSQFICGLKQCWLNPMEWAARCLGQAWPRPQKGWGLLDGGGGILEKLDHMLNGITEPGYYFLVLHNSTNRVKICYFKKEPCHIFVW